MSKSPDKLAEKARRLAAAQTDKTPNADDVGAWARTVRETVESVVIAFVLAFLFRTFEAEAFVIPTGSMAPTLMGRHMDLACPKCGFAYQVGAGQNEENSPKLDGTSGICPICGYETIADEGTPYYNGDRILVNKFAFDFAEPRRWDVIVFKFPEDAKTNYIKRLIGLPGEVIRIRDGDITVSLDGGKNFDYVPRDPAKLRAMLQIVDDHDYVYEPFIEKGWPARWQSAGPGWGNAKRDDGAPDRKVFAFDPKAAGATPEGEAWLRYYHFVPGRSDWLAFEKNQQLTAPRPQPITDAIAYDRSMMGDHFAGPNQVSDLAVECDVNVTSPTGKLLLELDKNGRPFRAQLDLASGAAVLSIPGRAEGEQPRATEGGISRAGSYRLLFANVDHQLTLLVNNKPVRFDKPTLYGDLETGADLDAGSRLGEEASPVGIGSVGAAVTVAHLRVLRDVYYTYRDSRGDEGPPHPNYRVLGVQPVGWPRSDEWFCFPRTAISKLHEAGTNVRAFDQYFFVGEDQFFPLGDNSPSSQDGRFWLSKALFDSQVVRFKLSTRTEDEFNFVDRRLLVGKALFIYWPHSFFFPIPNFSRMRFVR